MGIKNGSKGLMVLRVKPTPTRFPTNNLYSPTDNTPLYSISSVCHPWGYARCRIGSKIKVDWLLQVDCVFFFSVQLLSTQVYGSGYDLACPLQCTLGLIHKNVPSRKKSLMSNKWTQKLWCNPEKWWRGNKIKMRQKPALYLMSSRPLLYYMCCDYALRYMILVLTWHGLFRGNFFAYPRQWFIPNISLSKHWHSSNFDTFRPFTQTLKHYVRLI